MSLTISASQFKATCLGVFDRVAAGELDEVVITKRGRVVGILRAPPPKAAPGDLFGCMRGTVSVPAGTDLTAPVSLDPLDAEIGLLHR